MDLKELPQLLADAEKFALDNDRMRYRPYFECAEAFCTTHDLVIGGKAGLSLLLDAPLSKDSFMWDLYCTNTFENAKKLANALFAIKSNHIDIRTITLQTNIKHREFTITIEARQLFKIYALDKYRDVSLLEIMEPQITNGWFGNKVKIFPPAIVLIDLYQTLYSAAKCSRWSDAIENERKIIAAVGGAVTGAGSFDRNVADDILLRSLLKDQRIVLIGDYACAKLGIGRGSRLQLLTDIPIAELSSMTSRVLSAEKDQLRRVKVTHERTVHVSYNLNIPGDFQINKWTVYAVVKGEQIALYDAFNSPAYEMIPYVTIDKIQVGCPYVLLRFIYIDMWVLKLIAGISMKKQGRGDVGTVGIVSDEKVEGGADNVLNSRINSLNSRADSVRKYISSTIDTSPFKIFSRDYIGINTSSDVAKKKIVANIGYRLPNYYPVLNADTVQ